MLKESREVAIYKDLPLVDIIRPLRDQQRDYIFLKLVGMNNADAVDLIDRSSKTVERWRQLNDQEFEAIESYLMSNKEKYVEDAAREYARIKRAKAILALAFIADKAFEWDTLDKVDKQSVLTALRELKDIGGDGKKGAIPYEEMILRRYE